MKHYFRSSEDKYMFKWKKENVISTLYYIELQSKYLAKDIVVERMRHLLANEKYASAFIDMSNGCIVFKERSLDELLYLSDTEDSDAIFKSVNPLAVISIIYNERTNSMLCVTDHCVYDGLNALALVCKYCFDENETTPDIEKICPIRPNLMLSSITSVPYIKDMLNFRRQTAHLIDLEPHKKQYMNHLWNLTALKEMKAILNISMSSVLLGKYIYHIFQQYELPSITVGLIVGFQKNPASPSFQNGFAMVTFSIERSENLCHLMRMAHIKAKEHAYHAAATSNQLLYDVLPSERMKQIREKVDVCFTTVPLAKTPYYIGSNKVKKFQVKFHSMSYPFYCCVTSVGDRCYGSTNTRVSTLKPF